MTGGIVGIADLSSRVSSVSSVWKLLCAEDVCVVVSYAVHGQPTWHTSRHACDTDSGPARPVKLIGHHVTHAPRGCEDCAFAQGLLLTSSPIAKSQKKPGGLRPIIAIAMAHPR